MTVSVELGAFTGFTLDNPVLGLLNTGILDGGIAFTNVTDGVFTVSTSRGRNRDLDRTNAGVVSVSFRNESRRFDPQGNSNLKPFLVPRKPVRVAVKNVEATGGTVSDILVDDVPFRVHTFTTNGTFTVTNAGAVEFLVLAGGGGGGRSGAAGAGGGGGAGGLIFGSRFVEVGSFAITVGSGGAGAAALNTPGQNGSSSTVFDLTAVGGGGGGGGGVGNINGRNGGSGGGSGTNASGANSSGGSGTAGQGNNGGSVTSATTNASAAGGGGASQVGANANANVGGGKGGDGLSLSITGTAVTYAGGGGGAGQATNVPGAGGAGGGGTGGGTLNAGSPGTDGLGAGGGGGGGTGNGGAGGGGVVIIRYRLDEPVFTGLMDDWNFSYGLGGNSTASLEGSDAFSLFAREVNAGGSAVEQLSGARVEAVLDELSIPWPTLERDVEDGNATFEAGVLEGNALTYLQQVEESEAGLIFMTKDGRFAFRERLFQPQTDAVQFSDNGGIPYENIQITFGAELLANEAIITNSTDTATASDATSQVTFGVTTRTVDSLLTDAGLQTLADYIVARYSEPEYRIENVTVNLRALSTAQRADVLSLELGDQADVVFTPNRVGSAIAIRNRVIGISHDVGVDTHTVSFSFEALPFDFFVLDDAVFGKLDNTDGVLGF